MHEDAGDARGRTKAAGGMEKLMHENSDEA